ncbi:hypothetical protein [Polymorphum gilvum]|uniref:hypothetical protein n=1 Tax=Polymorphum gilvum TaxID=991904 RepID=UPI0002EB94B9|nr:hypothetical protein [Polymorphum gilvum]
MDSYPDNFEDFLATTAEMLVADGLVDAADLLKSDGSINSTLADFDTSISPAEL